MKSFTPSCRPLVLGASALALAAAAPAASASFAEAYADVSALLSIDKIVDMGTGTEVAPVDAFASGLDFFGFAGNDSSYSSHTPFFGDSDVFDDTIVWDTEVELAASTYAFATPTDDALGAFGYASTLPYGAIDFANLSGSTYEVTVTLDYDFFGEAEVDGLYEEYAVASASVGFMDDFDDGIATADSLFGDLYQDFVPMEGGLFSYTFELAPGDYEVVEAFLSADSEAFAVVPVPAALPLALAGFGILGFMARRRPAAPQVSA